MANRDKIDRTIMRSLDMVEKLEKLFANNGAFEQAVAEIGGDIGWFGDVRENLKTLYSNIEELHMGAVSHMDMEEAAKPDFADIDGDGDEEESMKKAANDKEANESLDRIKQLAGITESDDEEEDDRDELTKKLFPKLSPDEMKKRDQERNRAMNQKRFMNPGKPSRSREWGAYE
jgi:hypothetical protein